MNVIVSRYVYRRILEERDPETRSSTNDDEMNGRREWIKREKKKKKCLRNASTKSSIITIIPCSNYISIISNSSVFTIFQSHGRWDISTARKSPIRARIAAKCTITTPVWRGIWSTNAGWNRSFTVHSALTERSTNPAWTRIWTAGIWNFWANFTLCQMGISCHPPWTLGINNCLSCLLSYFFPSYSSSSCFIISYYWKQSKCWSFSLSKKR